MQGIQPTVDATDYFVISPNSGLITIAKSLATDTAAAGSGTGKRAMYRVNLTFKNFSLSKYISKKILSSNTT